LWENRSIYFAPLAVAGVILFGFLVRTPCGANGVLALDPAQQRAAIASAYDFPAGLMILTAFVVGAFYCLDALHSERHDRSILFWKSLPVSDLTTVLSKASMPLVVLPLLIFAIVVIIQMSMLLLGSAVLLGHGRSAAALWGHVPLFKKSLTLLYALTAIALWHAPLYGWLLLVSAWARRAVLLWAVLPVFAIGVFEWIAFRTPYTQLLLKHIFLGWYAAAFAFKPHGGPFAPPIALDPGKFLSAPGLWIGLLVAASFLAVAARLRRYREPM